MIRIALSRYVEAHKRVGNLVSKEETDSVVPQLRDPRMNLSVVRPLVDKFYEKQDVSMGVFTFLILN
jgi:hypothetical protein